MRMVTVTIDEKKFEVAEGTTVLRAAESAGIHIPTLCDHKSLAPYGGCRLCLVEVEGMRTLQPSCTLPVNPNMVVHTNTAKVKEAREFVLTLLFSERNHFCMYCQVSGGDCELQNSAYAEGMTHWPLQPGWTPFAIDASNPYFVLDNNRCILCRRCVRACGELVGNYTLGIEERGTNSLLIADLGTPLGDSTCISCGTCVQVCPTGALIDRQSAYLGRVKDSILTKSICTQFSVGCGIEVIHRDNRVNRIEGDWDSTVNAGLLCVKGRFEPVAETRERLVTPMVKKGDGLKAATYKDAVIAAAAGLKAGDLAALVAPSLSAETIYQFKKLFADGLKSDKAATLYGKCYTKFLGDFSAIAKKPYEASLVELANAECVITIGADLIDNHQVAGFLVRRAQPIGTHLIVVSDDESKIAEYADEIVAPKGDLVGALSKLKSSKNIEKSASICVVVGNMVPENLAKPVLDFVEDLRKAGKTINILSLKGMSNSYAAHLYQLDKAVDYKKVKAAFIVLGEEEPNKKLLKDLEGVPFVAVQAAYASPLTARADVVFPAPIWAEQDGTYINLEGKVQTSIKVINPPDGVQGYSEVLGALANAAGVKLDGDWSKGLSKNLLVTELLGA
jgi:formate dehydrogenase major subunit